MKYKGILLSDMHWSETPETQRLMRALEALEAAAGGNGLALDASAAPKPTAQADLVELSRLRTENSTLKTTHREVDQRLEKLIDAVTDKLDAGLGETA